MNITKPTRRMKRRAFVLRIEKIRFKSGFFSFINSGLSGTFLITNYLKKQYINGCGFYLKEGSFYAEGTLCIFHNKGVN